MKTLLAILGAVSLALGIAGIFLPLLPTTPFLLLSAALWVRSSPRLYAWLLAHPRMGPYIRDFREHRAIPLRAKLLSLTLLWLTLGADGAPAACRRHHVAHPLLPDCKKEVIFSLNMSRKLVRFVCLRVAGTEISLIFRIPSKINP